MKEESLEEIEEFKKTVGAKFVNIRLTQNYEDTLKKLEENEDNEIE